MVMLLMIFCAAGAVLLIALAVYAEFEDLWPHSPKHRPHPPIGPHHP
jgi:hypothetical protein